MVAALVATRAGSHRATRRVAVRRQAPRLDGARLSRVTSPTMGLPGARVLADSRPTVDRYLRVVRVHAAPIRTAVDVGPIRDVPSSTSAPPGYRHRIDADASTPRRITMTTFFIRHASMSDTRMPCVAPQEDIRRYARPPRRGGR